MVSDVQNDNRRSIARAGTEAHLSNDRCESHFEDAFFTDR